MGGSTPVDVDGEAAGEVWGAWRRRRDTTGFYPTHTRDERNSLRAKVVQSKLT